MTGHGEPYFGLADGVLPFMSENQGVCTWALALHEGPDPKVLVEVDTMPRPSWQVACESFRVWLRCWVEDGLMNPRVVYSAQAPPLSGDMLAHLRDAFTEGPRTYAWPGKTNYRFRGPAADLLLWAADDQCDWFVAPKGDFELALRSIPKVAQIIGSLYSLTDDGEPALAAIRSG